jgi:hypothetical protein
MHTPDSRIISWAPLSGAVLAAALAPVAAAGSTVYHDQPAFAAAVSAPLTTVTFDDAAACNACLTGAEYAALGMTFVQLDGLGMNRVGNTVPGWWGANFVTEACLNSAPNAVSSSIFTETANQWSDRFEFRFDPPVRAAGAFIGNLGGGCCPDNGTVVEFVAQDGTVLHSYVVSWDSPGVIFGPTGQIWDNRVFAGAISAQPIKAMRVLNNCCDGDGIIVDDVQFAVALPTCAADLNGDGQVNGADLGLLLANWGGTGIGDLDGSGTVTGADLGIMLAAWGACGAG